MTFFIGGKFSGTAVGVREIQRGDLVILKPYGSHTGMERPQERYVRTKINLNGDIKTFYILDGEHPSAFKKEIVELWDQVETEVYAI